MTTIPPLPQAPIGPSPAGAGQPNWPTAPSKPDELAGHRSQLAVYVVCATAIGIVTGATSTLGWGVAMMLGLAGGVAISIVVSEHRPLGSVPGGAAAAIVMMVLTVALAFVGTSSAVYGLIPIVGAFVLGLDWRLVRRLRPLPFAFGFLVVAGVSGGETWTYPAGLVWLALALGALTSLEADRRTAQPKVEAVQAGPVAPDVQTGDLVTTVLVALALALVAALLMSTPSCQRSDGNRSGSGSGGSGQIGSGSGSGQTGSGSGSGQTGSGGRPGSGIGPGANHLYVPDPDGQYLIPNDGSGGSRGVPSPELLPEPGDSRSWTLDDGTQITAERDRDGTGRITEIDPDGTQRTFTYRERSDGLIEIQERDEQGQPGRTLYYDPKGKLATDDQEAAGGSPGSKGDTEKDDGEKSHLDWRLLALLAVALAAAGGFAWWWSRRPPKAVPDGSTPPWALRLAREIGREGGQRGRPRRPSQSLVHYAAELAAGPLPDARLPAVADVVSTALFARNDPGPDAQRWAESTWAEILATYPTPDRAQRRRVKADATSG